MYCFQSTQAEEIKNQAMQKLEHSWSFPTMFEWVVTKEETCTKQYKKNIRIFKEWSVSSSHKDLDTQWREIRGDCTCDMVQNSRSCWTGQVKEEAEVQTYKTGAGDRVSEVFMDRTGQISAIASAGSSMAEDGGGMR
eukprot:747297-Hanusia_phi.AAC.4